MIPAAVILALWGVLFVYSAFNDGGKAVLNGVSVAGTDLSGKTPEQAEQALRTHLKNFGNTTVSFVVDGRTTPVALSDLGVTFKDTTPEKLAEKAYRYGKSGGALKRFFSVKRAKKKGKDFKVTYTVDETKAAAALKNQLPPFENGAVDAAIKHTPGGFQISEEKEGLVLDEAATIELLNELLESYEPGDPLTVETAGKIDKPKITADMLAPITDTMGSYTTEYGGGDERSVNIECGAGHLNGLIVLPGEEISVNAMMEPYTEENGYVAAGSYESGKVVDTMGGGICQVSTTLYNALLYSELEITERHQHSLTVNYIDPGRDAAIADDVKDLKFRNNTDAPILIESTLSGGNITFTIYGHDTRAPGHKVEYETETSNVEVSETIYNATTDPVGYINATNYGHNGMDAVLIKVVYENGQEVSREEITQSSYRKTDTTIDVGTVMKNGNMSSAMLQAINTGDYNKIKAAVYAGY